MSPPDRPPSPIDLPLSPGVIAPAPFFAGIAMVVVVGVGTLGWLALDHWTTDAADDLVDLELAWLRHDEGATAQTPMPATLGADLYLTSDRTDAVVYLGQDSVGMAPLLLADLAPGRHRLRIESSGTTIADTALFLADGTFMRFHAAGDAATRARARRPSRTSRAQAALLEAAQAAWNPEETLSSARRVEPPRVGWVAPPSVEAPPSPRTPATGEEPRRKNRVAW